MPIDVTWYVPNRVIMMRPHGHITIREAIAADTKIIALYKQSSGVVHTLVDQTDLDETQNIGLHEAQKVFTAMKHPRCGWSVAFGKPEPSVDLLESITARFGRLRFRSFLEHEDALNFLAQRDPEVAEALEIVSGVVLENGLLPA